MRKILVGIKRVIDYNVRVRVRPDGSGVVTEGVKMSANPFDSIALEEALRLRERGEADEIVAVSVGPTESQQQLRDALAKRRHRAQGQAALTRQRKQPPPAPAPFGRRGALRRCQPALLRGSKTRAGLRQSADEHSSRCPAPAPAARMPDSTPYDR